MAVDWDLAPKQNLFADFAQGVQYGRANKQYRQDEAARKAYASGDDVAAERAFIEAGNIDAADAIHKRRVEDRREQARQEAVTAVSGGDYEGGQKRALAAGDTQLAEAFAKMDATQRAKLKEHSQAMAAALYQLKDLPPDQQAARWQAMIPHFSRQGYSPEELAIDFTKPGAINAEIADALTFQQMLEHSERDRALTETQRHNRAVETRPVLVGNGGVLVAPGGDGEGRPGVLFRNPKTFAPPRRSGGGGGAPAAAHGPPLNVDPSQVKWNP
jgi:hypothetical protein